MKEKFLVDRRIQVNFPAGHSVCDKRSCSVTSQTHSSVQSVCRLNNTMIRRQRRMKRRRMKIGNRKLTFIVKQFCVFVQMKQETFPEVKTKNQLSLHSCFCSTQLNTVSLSLGILGNYSSNCCRLCSLWNINNPQCQRSLPVDDWIYPLTNVALCSDLNPTETYKL